MSEQMDTQTSTDAGSRHIVRRVLVLQRKARRMERRALRTRAEMRRQLRYMAGVLADVAGKEG